MNTVEKTSTGVTPAKLILSHSIRLSSHIMTPVQRNVESSDISLSSRLGERISRQHTLRLVAQEHQLQTDYPMGRSNKLLARYKGPYQVIGKRQSIYIIEDLVKGKQIKTHVHNLRPIVFNPTQVNSLDVAQQNEQEFVVDGILAHRGNHH